jgi:hypothetical protein
MLASYQGYADKDGRFVAVGAPPVAEGMRAIIVVLDNFDARTDVSPNDRMESANALLGIIPDDFDLDEMRAERILGSA